MQGEKRQMPPALPGPTVLQGTQVCGWDQSADEKIHVSYGAAAEKAIASDGGKWGDERKCHGGEVWGQGH